MISNQILVQKGSREKKECVIVGLLELAVHSGKEGYPESIQDGYIWVFSIIAKLPHLRRGSCF